MNKPTILVDRVYALQQYSPAHYMLIIGVQTIEGKEDQSMGNAFIFTIISLQIRRLPARSGYLARQRE
jgi:hypothetical protein